MPIISMAVTSEAAEHCASAAHLVFQSAWIGPDVMMGAGGNQENLPVQGVRYMLIVNFVVALEHRAV